MASMKPDAVIVSPPKKGSYVSKGERYSVDPKVQKEIRQARTFLERQMLKLKAWKSGKTPNGMENWSRKRWPDHDKSEKVKMPEDLADGNVAVKANSEPNN